MARKLELVADAELEVLKALWARHPLTAREITVTVYGDGTASYIGTVQKLLQRLEKKRCVKRDRRDSVHRFSAIVSRQAVAGRQLDEIARKVTNGSLAPFITHLVGQQRLSEGEKDEIRRLLDE